MSEALDEVIASVSWPSGTYCLKQTDLGFGLEYMNKCVLFIQNRTTMKCAFTCIIGRKTSKVTLSSALCSTTSFFTSLSVGFWGSRVVENVTLCFDNSIYWQWWERGGVGAYQGNDNYDEGWCWTQPGQVLSSRRRSGWPGSCRRHAGRTAGTLPDGFQESVTVL